MWVRHRPVNDCFEFNQPSTHPNLTSNTPCAGHLLELAAGFEDDLNLDPAATPWLLE